MTSEFFEGSAGCGKTHNLIERTRELVEEGVLAQGQRILALTFMNGARRRLEASLSKHAELRRKFECKTVDVFARTVASRRRSQLANCTAEVEAAEKLNQFDSICYLAAHLLQSPRVAQWIAASYPLVVIDEAQDLDPYRLPILQGLSSRCAILAAADEFQCLNDGMDTSPVVEWLNSFDGYIRLDGCRRTSQSGILTAAHAVRSGGDLTAGLTKHRKYPTWRAPGFKLIELPARAPFLAWTVSNELKDFRGSVAILTPDTTDKVIRDALGIVCEREWTYKKTNPDVTFGPFAVEWDVKEQDRAEELCKQLELPDMCSIVHIEEAALAEPALLRVRQRMERAMRVRGERTFSSDRVSEMISDAVRDVSRFGGRRGPRRTAMSIHRAKNREFNNVLVLWPYGATGGEDHLRRLLYNAITRAQEKCTVIVLGKNRLRAAPFAPAENDAQPSADTSRSIR